MKLFSRSARDSSIRAPAHGASSPGSTGDPHNPFFTNGVECQSDPGNRVTDGGDDSSVHPRPPFLAAIALDVADLQFVRRCLAAIGVRPAVDSERSLILGPAGTCGVILEFRVAGRQPDGRVPNRVLPEG